VSTVHSTPRLATRRLPRSPRPRPVSPPRDDIALDVGVGTHTGVGEAEDTDDDTAGKSPKVASSPEA